MKISIHVSTNEKRHPRWKCPARDSKCHFCDIQGHFQKCCLKKKNQDQSENNIDNASSSESNNQYSHHKNENEGNHQNKPKINTIYHHQNPNNNRIASVFLKNSSNRKFIDVKINSKPTKLQIDSGADVSIISKKMCDKLQLKLLPTNLNPINASGKALNIVGKVHCTISTQKKSTNSIIYVSPHENLNIFGNDLFNQFDLWNIPINEFCSKEIHLKEGRKKKKKITQSNKSSFLKRGDVTYQSSYR